MVQLIIRQLVVKCLNQTIQNIIRTFYKKILTIKYRNNFNRYHKMQITILPFLVLLITASLFTTISSTQTFFEDQTHQIYQSYLNWKRQFQITFSEQQDQFRSQIFLSNLAKIQLHNSQSTRSYMLGINQFAHLTEFQFSEIFLNKQLTNHKDLRLNPKHPQINFSYINVENLTDIDWQTLGKISQVKNQGNCNSGYAFSTTSLIESSLMMENQNFILSQQQIIDCALDYGAVGCEGGSRQGALKYAQQKGLLTQRQYPYTGAKGNCKAQKGKYLPDFTIVEANGCDAIKSTLYKSPITVAVDAKNWQLYSSGIFNNCGLTSEVNHQGLLVGVSMSYWRLKNSWGSRWGEGGYIRIKLGNFCGICERPGYGFWL